MIRFYQALLEPFSLLFPVNNRKQKYNLLFFNILQHAGSHVFPVISLLSLLLIPCYFKNKYTIIKI